jgi:hypothetical protein
MHAAEDSVKDAGWLDDTPNGIDKVNTIPFYTRASTAW